MPRESDPVRELTELLREVGASPRVRPERIARSTLYDLDYHVALVACVIFITAGDSAATPHRVVAQWMKILQFIAVRPSLLKNFQIWAGTFSELRKVFDELVAKGLLSSERATLLELANTRVNKTGSSLLSVG
jgi:hypothetical protein